MSTTSASNVPANNLEKIEFSDPHALDLSIRMVGDINTSFEYLIDLPTLEDIKYHHGKIITQSDVVSKVVTILARN